MAAVSTSKRGRAPQRRHRFGKLLASLACIGGVAACRATRELEIESSPSGAEVRLDDVVVGTTPVHVPFKDYGTRRITLYKPGFVTHSELFELDPPWYATFPIDFLTEVLLPIGWHDVQHYEATLVPGTGSIASPDLADVLSRAEVLRRAGPEGPKRAEPKNGEPKPPQPR